MAARIAWLAALVGLQLVALTLAHDLTFLARYGSRFNEALVHSGHGAGWSAAVGTSIGLALLLAGLAAARLLHVRAQLRRPDRAWAAGLVAAHAGPPRSVAGRVPEAWPSGTSFRALGRGWVQLGVPMAALTTALLAIQENLERASIGAAVPGPTILLTPEYAGGVWIALAVGLLVGLVAALFRWRLGMLLARLRASRLRRRSRALSTAPRPGLDTLPPRGSVLGRRSALRAPPGAVAP